MEKFGVPWHIAISAVAIIALVITFLNFIALENIYNLNTHYHCNVTNIQRGLDSESYDVDCVVR